MTRAALFTRHRRVALGIAADWRIPHLYPDDVRQEALVALWEATGSYDKTRGTFPAWARLVIKGHLRDLLQAATRQKRTAPLEPETEPVAGSTEDRVLVREQLRLAIDDQDGKLTQRARWREAKRRQRAAA